MVESSVRETYTAAVARPVAFAVGAVFGATLVSVAWYVVDRTTERQLSLLRDENVHQEKQLKIARESEQSLERTVGELQAALSAAQQASVTAAAEEWEYSPASEPMFTFTQQKLDAVELNPEQESILRYLFEKDGARSGTISEGVSLTVGRVDYELKGLGSKSLIAAGTCHRKGETTLYTCWGLTDFGRKYVVKKLEDQPSTVEDPFSTPDAQSSNSMEPE